MVLGFGDETSTGTSYPRDSYFTYGLMRLLTGMSILGIVEQWLTNGTTGALDERRLFAYAGISLAVTDMEIDVFSFWSGFIKTFVILSGIAWLIYGPRRHSSEVLVVRGRAFPRP